MILTIADPNSVPEGYTPFFGKLYVQKTSIEGAIDVAKTAVKPVSFVCEMALAAVQKARELLTMALAAVQELYNTIMSVLNEVLAIPMEMLNEMLNRFGQAVDGAVSAITSLIPDGGALTEAFDQLMKCSAFADSESGKELAGIMDEMDEAGNLPDEAKNKLKDAVSQTAMGAMDEFMSHPLAILSDINSKYEEALEALQIGKIYETLNKLEECARGVCKPAELVERLPNKAEDLLAGAGAKYDAATGKLTSIAKDTWTGEKAAVMNAAGRYKALAAKIPGVG